MSRFPSHVWRRFFSKFLVPVRRCSWVSFRDRFISLRSEVNSTRHVGLRAINSVIPVGVLSVCVLKSSSLSSPPLRIAPEHRSSGRLCRNVWCLERTFQSWLSHCPCVRRGLSVLVGPRVV